MRARVAAEAASWALQGIPTAVAEFPQLLPDAVPPPAETKGWPTHAVAGASMPTALQLQQTLPEGYLRMQQNRQLLTLPASQKEVWREHNTQQRRRQVRDTPIQPYGGHGAPRRPLFRPLHPANKVGWHHGASEAHAQWPGPLGMQTNGWLTGECNLATEAHVPPPPPLAVPPVGCATSYEELIAFFRGLAEQQQPLSHEGRPPDKGEKFCWCSLTQRLKQSPH